MKSYKIKRKTNRKIKRKTKTQKAGKVIQAGSYGCVFSNPALKCKGEQNPRDNISKLLTTKEAYNEWNENLKILPKINSIVNSNNYFLIANNEPCTPNRLTSADKEDFDEKCKIFSNISVNNINEKLESLKILHMPDGGVNISEIFTVNSLKYRFVDVNNALINLLKNGIIPMNSKELYNVYHLDIKSDNILFKNNNARLIDWGLAITGINNKLPNSLKKKNLYNNFILINNPYSSFMFCDTFNNFVMQRSNYKIPELYSDIEKYYRENMFIPGNGHTDTLILLFNQILKILNISDLGEYGIISESILFKIIINYLNHIVLKYTSNKDEPTKPFIFKYFEDVYSKNVDVWGFISSYILLLNFKSETIKLKIINIFLDNFFSIKYAADPIDINNLINQLYNLFNDDIFVNKQKIREKLKNIINMAITNDLYNLENFNEEELEKYNKIDMEIFTNSSPIFNVSTNTESKTSSPNIAAFIPSSLMNNPSYNKSFIDEIFPITKTSSKIISK